MPSFPTHHLDHPAQVVVSADPDGHPRAQVAELLRRNAQLQHALDHRPVVEHLVGMVVLLTACDPQTAWARLSRVSQDTNRKVSAIADDVLQRVGRGEGFDEVLLTRLRQVVVRSTR